MDTKEHYQFMSLALKLAKKGLYTTRPNPMVGCVIVKNNQIVGKGYHHKYGGYHAEIEALNKAGSKALGATMYINLEPCCHQGKTGPCTQAIIDAGIAKVFIAHIDHNPLVNGSGIKALQDAGIEVSVGLMQQQAKEINRYFFHNIKHTTPYVIAKWAMSLDGKSVTHPQDTPQISGPKSEKFTHQLRKQVDAIIVGAGTILADNPMLTMRLGNQNRQPLRVILSSRGILPIDANIFNSNLPGKTLLVTTNLISKMQLEKLTKHNITVMITKADVNNQVDLIELLNELRKMGIYSLLVEGGMTTHNSFFRQNLVNEIITYVAPVIVGDLKHKRNLPNMTLKKVGHDYILRSNLYV